MKKQSTAVLLDVSVRRGVTGGSVVGRGGGGAAGRGLGGLGIGLGRGGGGAQGKRDRGGKVSNGALWEWCAITS